MSDRSVLVSEEFFAIAKDEAVKQKRSTTKQIEHWAVIGKRCEENPDLPWQFIQDTAESWDSLNDCAREAGGLKG